MEKIFASYTSDKRLITRIHLEFKKLNSENINDPMKKWANELNRAFSKEKVQMVKKTHEEMVNSPGHKGNGNQNHIKFYLTSARMANMKNTNNNKCWRGCGKKGTLIHCWWECKLVQPLWKTVWRPLKKLKIELPYHPAITLLQKYPKEGKSGYNRDTYKPIFIAALFTTPKLWKQPGCSTTAKWIKKM
jgi:hypothetical protein